jgi:hypothetical protein
MLLVQAEMAIDCLNTKIAELEERNQETEKIAEKYMDEVRLLYD